MIARTLVVGVGGFLGAAARYLLGGAIYRWLPATFPWATCIINVTTTFSTFGYETILLLRESSFGAAALNVLAQVALGLLAVWAGGAAARVLP